MSPEPSVQHNEQTPGSRSRCIETIQRQWNVTPLEALPVDARPPSEDEISRKFLSGLRKLALRQPHFDIAKGQSLAARDERLRTRTDESDDDWKNLIKTIDVKTVLRQYDRHKVRKKVLKAEPASFLLLEEKVSAVPEGYPLDLSGSQALASHQVFVTSARPSPARPEEKGIPNALLHQVLTVHTSILPRTEALEPYLEPPTYNISEFSASTLSPRVMTSRHALIPPEYSPLDASKVASTNPQKPFRQPAVASAEQGSSKVRKLEHPACNACKHRHLRCDRLQPCNQCKTHQCDCVYPASQQVDGALAGTLVRKMPHAQVVNDRKENRSPAGSATTSQFVKEKAITSSVGSGLQRQQASSDRHSSSSISTDATNFASKRTNDSHPGRKELTSQGKRLEAEPQQRKTGSRLGHSTYSTVKKISKSGLADSLSPSSQGNNRDNSSANKAQVYSSSRSSQPSEFTVQASQAVKTVNSATKPKFRSLPSPGKDDTSDTSDDMPILTLRKRKAAQSRQEELPPKKLKKHEPDSSEVGDELIPEFYYETRSKSRNNSDEQRSDADNQLKGTFLKVDLADVTEVNSFEYPVYVPVRNQKHTYRPVSTPAELEVFVSQAKQERADRAPRTDSAQPLPPPTLPTNPPADGPPNPVRIMLDRIQQQFADSMFFLIGTTRYCRAKPLTIGEREYIDQMSDAFLAQFRSAQEEFEEKCRDLGILSEDKSEDEQRRSPEVGEDATTGTEAPTALNETGRGEADTDAGHRTVADPLSAPEKVTELSTGTIIIDLQDYGNPSSSDEE